jgi:hypothetical protein
MRLGFLRRHGDSSSTKVEEKKEMSEVIYRWVRVVSLESTITTTAEEKVRQQSNLAVRATAGGFSPSRAGLAISLLFWR